METIPVTVCVESLLFSLILATGSGFLIYYTVKKYGQDNFVTVFIGLLLAVFGAIFVKTFFLPFGYQILNLDDNMCIMIGIAIGMLAVLIGYLKAAIKMSEPAQ